jgi:uncharacterized membrane protein
MSRVLGWLGIIALAVCARWFDSAPLRAVCVPALLLLIASSAPMTMRLPLIVLAVLTALPIGLGFGDALLDTTPALVAALVGWMFARTLLRDRRPLIARAVVAMDGPQLLEDPAVARYTRRLTLIWALYQAALAAIALILALCAWYGPLRWPALPGPRLFGVVWLPLAVAALVLAEFVLRPRLLPQAPPRSLYAFVRDLVRAWPALLAE